VRFIFALIALVASEVKAVEQGYTFRCDHAAIGDQRGPDEFSLVLNKARAEVDTNSAGMWLRTSASYDQKFQSKDTDEEVRYNFIDDALFPGFTLSLEVPKSMLQGASGTARIIGRGDALLVIDYSCTTGILHF
jgi:hypothetical protein